MTESNARTLRKSLPVCDADPPSGGANGLNRRDFLRAAGFTFAGALLSGCERAPREEAIPPLIESEDVIPGQAAYYASTCGGCGSGCGMLVKSRDGRPIKLEGDPDHVLSQGGLCAAGQASLLGLYDRLRLQQPLRDGREVAWDEIDRDLRARLEAIRRQGGAVRVLTGSITSPTTRAIVQRFLGGFADARHVVYDPVSCSAILDAHQRTHGVRVLPHYRLDRAEVILSVDADFLGTWVSPVEFAAAYRVGRPLTPNPAPPGGEGRSAAPQFSYLVQVESRLSLTGSKADERVCVSPEEMDAILTRLAIDLARRAGVRLKGADAAGAEDRMPDALARVCDRLAERLWQTRRRSLVLCGRQEIATQIVCNFVNHVLENYGSTLDIERPSLQRQGSDRALEELLGEIYQRKVAALFVLDRNPVYDLPDGERLAEALRDVPLVVYCGEQRDETARVARYVCPHPHYLESWDDAEPVSGILSLLQPTMPRLGNTRPIIESLCAWAGPAQPAVLPTSGSSSVGLLASPRGPAPLVAAAALVPKAAYDLVREYWQVQVFPRQSKERNFQTFWEGAVHDGHVEVAPNRVQGGPFDVAAVERLESRLRPAEAGTPALPPTRTLVLYPKVGLPDGSHAYNPWLQELPDPISKVTWDNYACLSPAVASEMGLAEGDVVRLEVPDRNGRTQALELPVFVQPGQHDRVIAVALGYGSVASERFDGIGPRWLQARPTVGKNGRVGQNAAALLAWEDGTIRYARAGVRLTPTGEKHPLAATQSHHSLTVPAHLAPPGLRRRPIIQDTTVAELARVQGGESAPEAKHEDLWSADHPYPDHRWGMVIDLNACTGCSACVIACQVENNIPVVGQDEVRRQREMHWLRIDRYYFETAQAGKEARKGDSPQSGPVDVAFQPMLCQQCEHAPCENVCPVLATVHSSEGLNDQTYNRCVGTRYCANNCPYRVRRFNWFAYAHEDSLQNLVLNPDVTVRSRGVMEKCTFCVQRIQEAKINARARGEALPDGAIQTACQQSCPARAITFGDVNNPRSQVARQRQDRRYYQVLAELNIGPSVGYLKVVRKRPEGKEGEQHG